MAKTHGVRSTGHAVRKDKALIRTLAGLLLLGCLILSAGCSAPEDTAYLTPIPDATVDAYRLGPRIRTRLDAVVVARKYIWTTRLTQVTTPRVVSVGEMDFAEANQRVPGSLPQNEPMAGKVWLVIFHGTWQLFPPDPMHTITPPAPYNGCVFALFYTDNAEPIAAGDITCPR